MLKLIVIVVVAVLAITILLFIYAAMVMNKRADERMEQYFLQKQRELKKGRR